MPSNNQKSDLIRQVTLMQETYPNHTIIKEVGSGPNFKRKGLQRIIRKTIQSKIEKVVVAYRDRLL